MGSFERKKICIITPSYLASSPRVIKEADALQQAGFEVCVIFSQGNLKKMSEFDYQLLKEKSWRFHAVGCSSFKKEEKYLYWKAKFRQNFFKHLPLPLQSIKGVAENSEGRVYRELVSLAVLEKADLYVGHYPTGLAAAAFAAFAHKAKLGYDIEDLHTEECPPNGKKTIERVRIIEKRYLPYCSYITVVSELVADEIVRHYKTNRPLVIHNVFPWSQRQGLDNQLKDRRTSAFSLYWYSQVIGLDRGIQDAIIAAGLLKAKVQIHLRGDISRQARDKLVILARDNNIEDRLYFHPPVSPQELLSRCAEHDVGLALEHPLNLSRMLTVSNKFFFYLLSGLAVAATDVPGQKYIMSGCPDAGFLYSPGDYQSLADKLNDLILDPEKLKACKQSALKAASTQWNWERESKKLIENIRQVFNE